MRQIGTIEDPQQAERFAAYLITQGTMCTLDDGAAGKIVWVHDEDRVADAKVELQRFLSEPHHDRYRDATRQAQKEIRRRQEHADVVRRQVIDVRERWDNPAIEHGPVTTGLLVLMVLVFVLSQFDPARFLVLYQKLLFSWPEICKGDYWRLITPIILHWTIMHLVFNFLSLRVLGLLVEFVEGTARFTLLVLVIALASNAGQYWMSGPQFGGMSGVIYGLFGYVWVRSRLEPESKYWISRQNVVMMLGWLVLCMVIPGIRAANWAHFGGLVAGAVIGAVQPTWNAFIGRR